MVESSIFLYFDPEQVNIIQTKSETDDQTVKRLIGTSKINKEDKRAQDQLDCPICMQILFNPVECSNCQKCFCADCAQSWIDSGKSDKCPLCQVKLVTKQPHRFVKEFIEGSLFQGCTQVECKQYNESIKYIDLIKHYQFQCDQIMVSCPLKCGDQYQRKYRKNHLEYCRNIKQICSGYQAQVQNQYDPHHKCNEYLKQQLRLSQERKVDIKSNEKTPQSCRLYVWLDVMVITSLDVKVAKLQKDHFDNQKVKFSIIVTHVDLTFVRLAFINTVMSTSMIFRVQLTRQPANQTKHIQEVGNVMLLGILDATKDL
ncbi:traf-type zinc finger family protein [Stylonychia lemnae]|uniref:Traf-type zinc finger family protein n=1 Tax=Stylonychia lemnae TaxID=5949 RepID=A0A078B968_STYLE|nr:traf-type zinc finger family protein [Stylonychia lemnae]|eukprot:CDW90108.1 traf-type zinc finger family protein [Stylonychia lemnae]